VAGSSRFERERMAGCVYVIAPGGSAKPCAAHTAINIAKLRKRDASFTEM
jgi:hypothetical protein